MPIQLIEKICTSISKRHTPTEISLEVNPTTASKTLIQNLKNAGVNRLSIGAQSLNNHHLNFLERTHTVGDTEKTLQSTAEIFTNWSMDIIYALPGQTPDTWETELNKLLQYKPPHVSLYQLTIEENTRFHKEGMQPAPTGKALALWEITHTKLNEAGLPWYEVSNHAQKQHECQHNKIYWQGGEYWGIGAGAHGRLQRDTTWVAQENIKNPLKWAKEIGDNKHPYTITPLSDHERAEENILMGLRLREGIHKSLCTQLNQEKIMFLMEKKYLYAPNAETIAVTEEGLKTLNAVIRHLLT